MVGNVYGPNDKRDTLDAALNYYYGSLDSGEDQYNSSKFKSAVQAVTGGIDKLRGYQTQLPRGVSDYDLDIYFESLGSFELIDQGYNIASKDLDVAVDAVRNGQIKAIAGQGNYNIYGRDGGVIVNADGTPVVFNVTQELIRDMKSDEQSGSFVEARRKKFMTPILQRDL